MTLLLLALLAAIPPSGQTVQPLTPMLYGNGTDGQRVQAVYVYDAYFDNRLERPWSEVSPYTQPQPPAGTTFRQVIEHDAGYVDATYLASAQYHNPTSFRRVRWVTDSAGKIDILSVLDQNFPAALPNRTDRIYLAWGEGSFEGICGGYPGCAGGQSGNDQFGVDNPNNVGGSARLAMYGGGDFWNFPGGLAHELTHELGSVQWSAPHVSTGGHVCAQFDLMGSHPPDTCLHGTANCTPDAWDTWWLLDACGSEYFNTWPFYGQQCANCWVGPRQNYLWNHWNVANSLFLVDHEASGFHFWDWQHETLDSWVGQQPCYYGSRLAGNCNVVIDGAATAWDQSVLAWEPQYRNKALRVPLNVP